MDAPQARQSSASIVPAVATLGVAEKWGLRPDLYRIMSNLWNSWLPLLLMPRRQIHARKSGLMSCVITIEAGVSRKPEAIRRKNALRVLHYFCDKKLQQTATRYHEPHLRLMLLYRPNSSWLPRQDSHYLIKIIFSHTDLAYHDGSPLFILPSRRTSLIRQPTKMAREPSFLNLERKYADKRTLQKCLFSALDVDAELDYPTRRTSPRATPIWRLRLQDKARAMSAETLGAIMTLSMWGHGFGSSKDLTTDMDGLENIINLKGGIKNIEDQYMLTRLAMFDASPPPIL
ncbi:uncharacterized protein PAC_04462 [Phialocephala subalpina]|uniref:Uncharacterized protein n=1 Tax=Phialocephala subalpina TaxID=576137 RepID=A0A1L7WP83_9HELO|nr:uncharacterized protein PAC_04462 [Phialocephala subalpina]